MTAIAGKTVQMHVQNHQINKRIYLLYTYIFSIVFFCNYTAPTELPVSDSLCAVLNTLLKIEILFL